MDMRRAWLKFGLTMVGVAAGAFTITVLACAGIARGCVRRNL